MSSTTPSPTPSGSASPHQNMTQYAILGVLLYHGPMNRLDLVKELSYSRFPDETLRGLDSLMTEGVVVQSLRPNTTLLRVNRILLEARSK